MKMEKSKKLGLERPTALNGHKLRMIDAKEKMVNKIESLWDNDSSSKGKVKQDTKKLSIKLETSGREKRKVTLKLESNNASVTSSNYTLISELLKEFFNVENNRK
jgi:anion-transporting  ArsA/GET3 family ATPase